MNQTLSSIALIYMGGTFGCAGEPLAPLPSEIFLPRLQQLLHANYPALNHFVASQQIRDSSQLEPHDWQNLLQQIQGLVQQGFSRILIVHGTDTLAYTAAFLAQFIPYTIFEPVQLVMTGSQFPLLQPDGQLLRLHSDALHNLTTAYNYLCAIASVTSSACWVAFDGQVWSAHTVQKIHTTRTPAFTGSSAAIAPLIAVTQSLNLQVLSDLNIAVYYALPLNPQLLAQQLEHLLSSKPQALIILAFGAGNLPAHPSIETQLQQAQRAEILVILSTQVAFGGVNFNYAAGHWLAQFGVLSASDLSLAAIHARLAWLLCQPLSFGQRQHQWQHCL